MRTADLAEKKLVFVPMMSHSASPIQVTVLWKLLFFFHRAWSMKIPRPYQVHYNPYTQTVEVLDTQDRIINVVNNVKSDLDVLHAALKKMD